MITEAGLVRLLPDLADWTTERRQDVMRGLGRLAEGLPMRSPDSSDRIAIIYLPPGQREASVYLSSCEDAIKTALSEGKDTRDPQTAEALIQGIRKPVAPGFSRVLIVCDSIRALLHVPSIVALQTRGGDA